MIQASFRGLLLTVERTFERIKTQSQSKELGSRVIFWFILFVGLNVLDTMLTNKAHAMLKSVGIDGRFAEANALLQPLTGSWLLILKGLFALILMMLAERLLRIPFRRTLTWACFILAVVCLWNAHSIGLI